MFVFRETVSIGKSPGVGQLAGSGDVAYVIATSGSTARPKLVPITHRAACSTIRGAVDGLALTPEDRCLNFSPLFHLLGFMSGLLIPVGSGGSIVCAYPFDARAFFHWLDEFRPTWFSAVPTILLEILDHASRGPDIGAVLLRAGRRAVSTKRRA